MPVVITCPACQQKARVPEAMLGQSVKCPACAATFTAPADAAPAPPPPTADAQPDPPARPPLPADADSLRSVRSGVGAQLAAQCFYAAALGLFLLAFLVTSADAVSIGAGVARRTVPGSNMPLIVGLLATVLLLVAGLLNLISCAVCVTAPPAQLARGLAIAALVLAAVAFTEMASMSGLALAIAGEMRGRFGAFGPQLWLSPAGILWLVEVAQLSVLALFWRAMSRILRDARGATLARRLAIAGPTVQMFLVVVWIAIATLGAGGQEVAMLAVTGWLAIQFVVVLAGAGVAARLWRRLKAAVPAAA